jgi:hypothetical protein
MGLDIYYSKCKRAEWKKHEEQLKEYESLPSDEREDVALHPDRNFDPEEIGYFRKVNFLIPFFDYSENCEYKEITRDELEELERKCAIVSAAIPKVNEDGEKIYWDEDIARAKKLLPTTSGFFFGSTDYDEWYFEDVKQVLDWVIGVLAELQDNEVVLMYCWW